MRKYYSFVSQVVMLGGAEFRTQETSHRTSGGPSWPNAKPFPFLVHDHRQEVTLQAWATAKFGNRQSLIGYVRMTLEELLKRGRDAWIP